MVKKYLLKICPSFRDFNTFLDYASFIHVFLQKKTLINESEFYLKSRLSKSIVTSASDVGC